jgi:hypothetical protein
MSQASVENDRKYQIGTVMDFWQNRARSMARANEKIMQGILRTTTRQMELGRDFALHNISVWQPAEDGGNTASLMNFARTRAAYHLQGIEQYMAGMKQITQESSQCNSEAAQMLIEDASATNQEASTIMSSATRESAKAVKDGMARHKSERAA